MLPFALFPEKNFHSTKFIGTSEVRKSLTSHNQKVVNMEWFSERFLQVSNVIKCETLVFCFICYYSWKLGFSFACIPTL